MTFGDHVVAMPDDYGTFELYAKNIGYKQSDVKSMHEQHRTRTKLFLSTKHFDPVDVKYNGTLREVVKSDTLSPYMRSKIRRP